MSKLSRRRFQACERGQSLVEFGLVLPILLLVFLGIFEFSRFFYTRLTLQHAVREATRYAVTGQAMTDPETGDPMTRANSIIRVIVANTSTLGVDVAGITIDPADGGGPEDIVRVSLDFQYDFQAPLVKDLLPSDGVTLSFATAMRNEPFFD